MARFPGRVAAYSFEGDFYAPKSTVAAWVDTFEDAKTEHRDLAPGDLDLPEEAHFGAFREQATPFWEALASSMDEDG